MDKKANVAESFWLRFEKKKWQEHQKSIPVNTGGKVSKCMLQKVIHKPFSLLGEIWDVTLRLNHIPLIYCYKSTKRRISHVLYFQSNFCVEFFHLTKFGNCLTCINPICMETGFHSCQSSIRPSSYHTRHRISLIWKVRVIWILEYWQNDLF